MADSVPAIARMTSEIFVAGRITYLRFAQFKVERMVIVESLGVTNPGSCLTLQWVHPNRDTPSPPASELAVQVHCLFEGVLHIVVGVIEDVSVGPKPRIRVRVDPGCLAVMLRKHPRYPVVGQARIGQEGYLKSCGRITPQEMDISMGGFGLTITDNNYGKGDELDFSLELLCGETQSPIMGWASHFVEGRAVIRRVDPIVPGRKVHLGQEFLHLSEKDRQILAHWLAIQDSAQRQI